MLAPVARLPQLLLEHGERAGPLARGFSNDRKAYARFGLAGLANGPLPPVAGNEGNRARHEASYALRRARAIVRLRRAPRQGTPNGRRLARGRASPQPSSRPAR